MIKIWAEFPRLPANRPVRLAGLALTPCHGIWLDALDLAIKR